MIIALARRRRAPRAVFQRRVQRCGSRTSSMSDPLDNPFGQETRGAAGGAGRGASTFAARVKPGLKLTGILFGLTAAFLAAQSAKKWAARRNVTRNVRHRTSGCVQTCGGALWATGGRMPCSHLPHRASLHLLCRRGAGCATTVVHRPRGSRGTLSSERQVNCQMFTVAYGHRATVSLGRADRLGNT